MTTGALLRRVLDLLAGSVQRGICRSIDPELAVTTGAIPTANRVYWMRLREGGTISAVRFFVQAQNGNLCVAYARNVGSGRSAAPGDVIASTGSFLCPPSTTTTVSGGANGDHEQPLDHAVTVRPGDWVGIAGSAAATLRCMTGAGAVDTVLMAGSAYREEIASGGPAIPTSRAALTPHLGRDWLIVGV